MATLRIENLSKTYKNGTRALVDTNLQISNGMFGLLGPNGAGKSTLMRIISGLQEPDSGKIYFNETEIVENKLFIKERLGYLPQDFDFYPRITAWELLYHFSGLKGIKNHKHRKAIVADLLYKTNLYDVRHKQLGGFSGGMKQRFGIAQCLLGNPELLIVDEPTAGLDPEERNRFYNLLSEIGENIILILSTHIVDDVQELCSKMAIINFGELLVFGNPEDILSHLNGKIWQKIMSKDEKKKVEEQYQVLASKLFLGNLKVNIFSEEEVPGFISVPPDLEDAYFYTIKAANK